jgi:non-ribosomal peptide synthetase component F
MLTQWSTVGTLLAHLAHAFPEREAVVWPPQRLTYATLAAQATTVARGLWAVGVRPGEPTPAST